MNIVKIEWSDHHEPNDICHYDHVIGQSPLGEFRIEWKGWKEHKCFTIDVSPFGYLDCYAGSLEVAKKDAQGYFESNIKKCIKP